MKREMIQCPTVWLGDIPKDWGIERCKYNFKYHKNIAGSNSIGYERLALTMQGVIKRSKEDADGLQPDSFDGYQIVNEGDLVFKLIDLAGTSTSRVGLSPYTGLVSPAYILLHADKQKINVTVQNPCLLQDDLSVPSKSSCQSFISADTVLPACANV